MKNTPLRKMKIRTQLVPLLSFALLSVTTRAQETTYATTNAWITSLNTFKLTEKWAISNELHERWGDLFSAQGHFLFRPMIDFEFHKGVKASFGYTYIRSNNYEPYIAPVDGRTENNIWEQILLINKFGKWKLQHRFREEHRWSDKIVVDDEGNASISGTNFSNRFRYRVTASRDIVEFDNGQGLFGSWFDEIWIPQGTGILPESFARNWMYIGLGWKFTEDMNVQTGYMHQFDKVGDNYISTPIWQTTIVYNVDFSNADE